jgi:hypothetical protein
MVVTRNQVASSEFFAVTEGRDPALERSSATGYCLDSTLGTGIVALIIKAFIGTVVLLLILRLVSGWRGGPRWVGGGNGHVCRLIGVNVGQGFESQNVGCLASTYDRLRNVLRPAAVTTTSVSRALTVRSSM